MIILIAFFYKYYDNDNLNIKNGDYIYHFFKDVHIIIFIGFGLLYTILKSHQWSSVALVLFISVVSIEFSFFCYI